MKKHLLLLIAVVITSLTSVCFAEVKQMTNKERQIKAKKMPYGTVFQVKQKPKKLSIMKFSIGMLESSRIDLRYTGYSAAEVIAEVEKLTGSKKGEFESTTEYNARTSSALKAKFLDSSSIEDVFAFVVPVPKLPLAEIISTGFTYVFNPDTGDVNLYAQPEFSTGMNGIGAPNAETETETETELNSLYKFELSGRNVSSSTYKARNGFGERIMVHRGLRYTSGIAVNISFLELEDLESTLVYQFKLDRSKAVAELPALKALIVMKLSSPYIAYNYTHSEPTRELPFDISTQDKYLTGEVLGIIYYSGRTGDIFARVPEKFGKSDMEVESEIKQVSQ
jgi:hypothetical protein